MPQFLAKNAINKRARHGKDAACHADNRMTRSQGALFLQPMLVPRQITDAVDHPHYLDAVWMRLTGQLLFGISRDAITNLVVEPQACVRLAVNERDVEKDVIEIRSPSLHVARTDFA